jgi:hypothetical protein
MSVMASRMSSIRLRQCLRDMHRLCQDAGTEARLQALGRAQIDGTPEQRLEVVLKLQEREEPDRPVKLHQEIDVAARTRLVARHRPEQGQPRHSEALMERFTLGLKLRKNLLPIHQSMILCGAGSVADVPPRESRPENERASDRLSGLCLKRLNRASSRLNGHPGPVRAVVKITAMG